MPENYTIPETLIVSAIGMGIVFAALGLLILLIILLAKTTSDRPVLAAAEGPALPPAPPAVAAIPANMVPAKGSIGEVKLYDVDDKTAALIMAIVADELETPLNELRFIAIREQKG